MADHPITYFAETDSRNKRVPFGIKNKDRDRHVYVIGKTGMGKSTLLENMAVQDIQNGHGVAFIDPHGKTADLLLEYVPQERIKDVIYFAPFDTDFPISFNVMEDVGSNKRHLVANGLMSAFKKIWVDAWSARMEYILSNILLALLEYPDSTLIGVNRMLADKDYRKKVVDNIKDPSVKSFWVDEFAKYGERYMQEAGAAIQNKIGQFISNPLVRNIIGQPKSSFDFRTVMDDRKILIINLSKGRVGEANANLIGSMIITKLYLAALSRADASESKLKTLPPFYLFVDEFQSFANESFADILSEARKYKLSLTVAHQYVEQMSEEVRAAVFGNVGTMISFRVGAYDAELLEKEYSPVFTAEDVVNLGFSQIYLKLMIDGVSSQPFSANTLPPIKKQDVNYRDDIIEHSRKTFASPRAEVEEAIRKWHDPVASGPAKGAGERTSGEKSSVGKNERTEKFEPVIQLNHARPAAVTPTTVRASTVSTPTTSSQSTPAQKSPHTPAAELQQETHQTAHTAPHANPHARSAQSHRAHQAQHTQHVPAPQNSLAQALADAKNEKKSVSAVTVAAVHQPPEPKPISLDALKKNHSKDPTPQNLSELRNALKDIVEKSKHDKPEKTVVHEKRPAQSAQPAQSSHPARSAHTTTAQVKQPSRGPERKPEVQSESVTDSKPKEVPEDVLRRILDIPKRK